MSGETASSAYTHTHTHKYIDCVLKNLICSQLKQITNGNLRQGKITEWNRNMAGLLFWKKKCLEVKFEGVQRGFLSGRKGKVIPNREAEDRESA